MEQQQAKPARRCSDCGEREPDVEFYNSRKDSKCKGCKRRRSRDTRRSRSAKVAIANQVVALLANLADRDEFIKSLQQDKAS